MVQGGDIILSLEGVMIACVTDLSIQFSNTFFNIRTTQSTGWQERLHEGSDWKSSGSGLVSFAGRNVWYNNGFGTPVAVDFKYHTDSDLDGYWEGTCWISVYGESSSGTGFGTYNFELIGNGKPTFVPQTVAPVGGIGAMIVGSTFVVADPAL